AFVSRSRRFLATMSGRFEAIVRRSKRRCRKDSISRRRASSGGGKTVTVPAVRGWAVFCMGVWLMGTVWTAIVATQNFYTIDRLLETQPNAAFTAVVDKLGYGETRDVLRYLSSELNRLYFQYWNIAQLAIGILALWLTGRL